MAWLYGSRGINFKFRQFKMADGRCLENHQIAISQRKFVRFWWNLVHDSTFGTRWQSRDQM